MRRVHKLTPTVLVTLSVLAGGLALTAAPALAGTGYGSTGSFVSEQGAGNGEFSLVATKEGEGEVADAGSGLAVNDETHDVYVVDTGNNRVEYFSSTGAYIGQFNGAVAGHALSGPSGIAVDNDPSSPSHGDVYVVDTGHDAIDKFSATGAYLNQATTGAGGAAFNLVEGVAVDPNGVVWVYRGIMHSEGGEINSYSNALVNVFISTRASGEGEFGFAQFGFAVDSEGNFYVLHRGGLAVAKLDSAGALLDPPGEALGGAGKTGIAVDLADNDVYLNNGHSLGEYGPLGELFAEFGERQFTDGGGTGIAVDSSNGIVYAADAAGNKVEIFAPGATPEEPKTEAAETVTATTAILKGELKPPATKLKYYFEYNLGTSCAGGTKTIEEGEGKVSQKVTGLEPSAQYTFCFVAENNFGHTLGAPEIFTTSPAPPEVVPGSEHASGVSSTGATLEGQVNPNNEKTSYLVEYSTSEAEVLASKGTKVSGAGELEGYGGQGIAVATGAVLAPGTTYYYRVVAKNATGTSSGTPIEHFTSIPVPTTETPSPIGTTTATLNGKLTPLNSTENTEYFFLYNLGEELVCTGEHETPHVSAGTGSTAASVSAPVIELQPNHKYTVCLVSVNTFGSVEDTAPVYFTTHPAPPSVVSESAAPIASATGPAEGVGALVNPNNEATTCSFEYGTEPSLTTGTKSVPCDQASLGNGYNEAGETASAHIENLEAGKTYYYRVVAKNAAGPSGGTIEHFTASVVPTVTTGAALDPARTSIVLDGTVNPNGVATSYHFAYIDQAGYEGALAGDAEEKANPYAEGASTTPVAAGEGTTPVEVEELIKGGLLPGTTYHYALVASTNTTSISGVDKTFTTAAPTPPLVTTGGASGVTLSTATISGSVGTQGLDVKYAFEVSTEPGNPGPPSGGGSIGAGITEAGVSVALQGLQPGTTYYYRLLATSTDGTSYGELQSFTTPGFPSSLTQPAAPPLIGTPSIAFPKEEKGSSTTTPKTLTNAQKLKAALKACHAKHGKKRSNCEKVAHKRFGSTKAKKGTKKR